jgi:branched-chain amino acid transport system ATP-binding protein
MSASNSLLMVDDIEVVYDRIALGLRSVSLRVDAGERVALLGSNGAGKTTTLRAISKLLAGERGMRTRGTVALHGACTERLAPSALVERGLVQVMEGRRCFAHLSIEDNLRTGAHTRRDGRAAIEATLEKVYAYFPRLKARRGVAAALTSGGEQQMCAIGRALMAAPTLMLLDEPSMGLAPQTIDEVFETLAALNRREGVAFLLAEQNAEIALAFCSRAYVLENGRVALSGSAESLRESGRMRSAYLGASVA